MKPAGILATGSVREKFEGRWVFPLKCNPFKSLSCEMGNPCTTPKVSV